MNRSQILLSLVLNEAEVPIVVQTFNDRLILQKAIYLLQEGGIQLGYPYNWYLRGPYSSRLSDDAFPLAGASEADKIEIAKYRLGVQTKAIVERIKPLIGKSKKAIDPVKHFELLASVLFLLKTKQASANPNELTDVLIANGKEYSPEEADGAVQDLKTAGYAF